MAIPYEPRNEALMYQTARLSGLLPDVTPDQHARILKQFEVRHKMADFSAQRERNIQKYQQATDHAELDRLTSVLNTRMPGLRSAEARAAQLRQTLGIVNGA